MMDDFATLKGRGANLKATIDQVADGRVYTANDALKMGLVDQIGYADEAYAKAAALAGLTKQHVVKYEREPSLLDIFSGDTSAKSGVSSGANFRGVNVKIDRSVLDEITTPRLMSIYRGE